MALKILLVYKRVGNSRNLLAYKCCVNRAVLQVVQERLEGQESYVLSFLSVSRKLFEVPRGTNHISMSAENYL